MSGLTDMIKLTPSEPCEVSTSGGEGWYSNPIGELIRRKNALVFDIYTETEEEEPIELVPEKDGLYHWRDPDGDGHWCFFLAETATHTYLTGNWRSSDGEEGVSIFIWPRPKHARVEQKTSGGADRKVLEKAGKKVSGIVGSIVLARKCDLCGLSPAVTLVAVANSRVPLAACLECATGVDSDPQRTSKVIGATLEPPPGDGMASRKPRTTKVKKRRKKSKGAPDQPSPRLISGGLPSLGKRK